MNSRKLRVMLPLLLAGSLVSNVPIYLKWRNRTEIPLNRPISIAPRSVGVTRDAGRQTLTAGEYLIASQPPPPVDTQPGKYLDLVERLKSEQFPREVIMAMAIAAHTGKVNGEVSGSFNAGLFAAMGYTPAEIESREREQLLKYGSLSPDKIAAVEAAEKAASEELNALSSLERRETTIDALLWPKLAVVLTSEELLDYRRFNSRTAKEVQSALQIVETTEAEYLQLVDSALARESRQPNTGSPRRIVGDRERAIPMLQEMQQVLGLERFIDVATKLSPLAGSIDVVYAASGIPTEARVSLFHRALASTWASRTREGKIQPDIAQGLYRDLTAGAGLNAEQIAAFDQTAMGRSLQQAMAVPEGIPSLR